MNRNSCQAVRYGRLVSFSVVFFAFVVGAVYTPPAAFAVERTVLCEEFTATA